MQVIELKDVYEERDRGGIVKWFNADKGYGFIATDDGADDFYFHVRTLKGNKLPKSGDEVRFQWKNGPKGPRATFVEITKPSERRTDDRIECPLCQRKVVPRIQFLKGYPYRSLCPFCATTIEQFFDPPNVWLYFWLVILSIVTLNLLL